MDILRKRRASIEVQELMASVKTDYEFFSNFESMFEPAIKAAKRQRSLSDNLFKYGVTKNNHQGFDLLKTAKNNDNVANKSIRGIDKRLSSKTYDLGRTTEPRRKRLHSTPSRDLWFDRAQSQKHSSDFRSRFTRIGRDDAFQSYDAWSEATVDFVSPPPQMVRELEDSFTRDMVIRERGLEKRFSKERLFQDVISQPMEVLFEETQYVAPIVQTRFTLENDGNPEIKESQPSVHDSPAETTKIIYRGLPLSEWSYDAAWEERTRNIQSSKKQAERLPSNPEKLVSPIKIPTSGELEDNQASTKFFKTSESPRKIPTSHREDRLTINASPTNQERAFIEENHVVNLLTNSETEKSTQEVIPVERYSPEERSPKFVPSSQILPNYVITRVGSLLWLGKDVVYPITLDEIRRRVQAPENFSFQMLIAYVRHSRAKGRQFLNYWKCQPTGKASRPNVLSKLCEADARELVDGIKKVNEEYFPDEKLARNAAENIFEDLRKASDGNNVGQIASQEVYVRDKVESIEKSRSVFRTLQTTLASSQDDENFEMFNIASHNAGLTNIKNNLNFLDGILEKIQSHIRRGHRNLASITG